MWAQWFHALVRSDMSRLSGYRHGRIEVDGDVHTFDLVITPNGIHADWWREGGHQVLPGDIDMVLEDPPEILVLGTGSAGRMAPTSEALEALDEAGIEVEQLPTERAVDRFNELADAGVAVGAGLHLTC